MPTTGPPTADVHPHVRRAFFWTPRLLTVAFAGFLGVFALDVLTMPLGPAEKAMALFMHLVPPILVLLVLVLVWRWDWPGAVLFPLLALVHLVSKWGQLDLAGYVIIEVPLVLLGGMFFMSWLMRGAPRETLT